MDFELALKPFRGGFKMMIFLTASHAYLDTYRVPLIIAGNAMDKILGSELLKASVLRFGFVAN